MEYTKETRLAAYKHASKLIQDGGGTFICPGIFDFFKGMWEHMNYYEVQNEIENNFPELTKRRPKGKTKVGPWWPDTERGRKRRVKVLDEIIKSLMESQ